MKLRNALQTFQQLRRVSGLLSVALISLPGRVDAATSCTESPTHEAFNVQGLKSELMVTALSCGVQDRYNAFVLKFRPNLMNEEERLNTYFKSNFGRGASKQRDDYVTQLANVQSKGGLEAGTVFCAQRVQMFDEVDALKDGADLSHYAEGKEIVQPESFESCTGPRKATSRVPAHRRRRASHR